MGGKRLQVIKKTLTECFDDLYFFAMSLVRDESVAQDLVHDVCLKALERHGQLREEDKCFQWILKIMVNQCKDYHRKTHRIESFDEHFSEQETDLSENVDEKKFEIDGEKLKSLIFSLPEEMRTVLVLIDLKEIKYKDAAEILGVPVGTVMSRLSRARTKLKELIMNS